MPTLFKQIATAGISVGMGALSIKGRDKGNVCLVIEVEGRMLKLVDGEKRSLMRPKTKHYKHVKILGQIMSVEEVAALICSDTDIREKDTLIRKTISSFLDRN
jgi:ribosomal protein L14E/L6E/L27E